MSRFKIVVALTSVLMMFVVSASPASAIFVAKKQWKGVVKVVSFGVFVNENVEMKCPANEIEARWSVQSKGQIKQHEKEGKQVQVKEGPQLHIKVLKWGKGCLETALFEKVPVLIEPCEIQILQFSGLTATGGFSTACVMKIPKLSCEIKIPAGLEKSPESNEGANIGLKAVTLENKVEDLFVKGTVEGITTEGPGGATCPKTNSTAKLKGLEALIEGVKAI